MAGEVLPGSLCGQTASASVLPYSCIAHSYNWFKKREGNVKAKCLPGLIVADSLLARRQLLTLVRHAPHTLLINLLAQEAGAAGKSLINY